MVTEQRQTQQLLQKAMTSLKKFYVKEKEASSGRSLGRLLLDTVLYIYVFFNGSFAICKWYKDRVSISTS